MPAIAGAAFAHAVGQALANKAGVDVLHIKGAAVDDLLLADASGREPGAPHDEARRVARPSTDADLLVRPAHIERFVRVLTDHGWSVAFSFNQGSPFRHAMTLRHDVLSPLDLHRWFPGIRERDESAFDLLWAQRSTALIAGCECVVPSVTAQRLILILHAVRSRSSRDIELAWYSASDAERQEVRRLARHLQCDVPLAAALDELESYRGRPDYALWRALRDGERSMARLWLARVRAEPTLPRRVATATLLIAPKPARLQKALGRPPTMMETTRELLRTVRRAVVPRRGHGRPPRGDSDEVP